MISFVYMILRCHWVPPHPNTPPKWNDANVVMNIKNIANVKNRMMNKKRISC